MSRCLDVDRMWTAVGHLYYWMVSNKLPGCALWSIALSGSIVVGEKPRHSLEICLYQDHRTSIEYFCKQKANTPGCYLKTLDFINPNRAMLYVHRGYRCILFGYRHLGANCVSDSEELLSDICSSLRSMGWMNILTCKRAELQAVSQFPVLSGLNTERLLLSLLMISVLSNIIRTWRYIQSVLNTSFFPLQKLRKTSLHHAWARYYGTPFRATR
jgi:hypothetical protein